MKELFIIAGPNGAGKTTASFTVLPTILDCKEFVNADEIAKGISPFNPESVSFAAGRIMLERINHLTEIGTTFAFETTLSTRSYVSFIKKAKKSDYKITLLFFYLNSEELAVDRVKIRVNEGGHNIPEKVIRRRYNNGLKNFFQLYLNLVDEWIFIDNSKEPFEIIANGKRNESNILNEILWNKINQ